MKSSTNKNIIIVILILLTGFFTYKSNNYKTLYEQRKDWTPPYFCSDEQSKDINFLLNTYDSRFHEARVVVALKDSGCFSKYPDLVKSAQVVVNKENEVVKAINNSDIASVDLIVEFEKDPLRLFKTNDAISDKAVLELTELVTIFNEKMKQRTEKELDKYFE